MAERRNAERKRLAKKDILKMCSNGENYYDIQDYIMEKYGYVEKYVQALIADAKKEMDARYEKWLDRIADKNYQRLTVIVDECMSKNNYRDAIKAIEVLNKLGNLYETKINLSSDEFKIKIDEQ